MMLLLLLLPLFSKIVIVEIKLLWLWGGVAGMMDRQLCTRTSSQPSTKRISMTFPYCHVITLRFISLWDSYYHGHGVHDAMRLILTWGIYYQKYQVTMMLMPSSLCHGRDHAVIRSMLICIDPCSHNDHSAISCQHKAQAAMILSHMLPGFILTRGL